MVACGNGNMEEVVGLFFLIFTCFGVLLALVVHILYVIAFCKIFQKAGFNWGLGLLMLVPIANIIMPLYLGFAKWPTEKPAKTGSKN